jgi:hypothetical protein
MDLAINREIKKPLASGFSRLQNTKLFAELQIQGID